MADDLEDDVQGIEQDDDAQRQQRIASATAKNPAITPLPDAATETPANIPGPSAGDKTPPLTLRGITPPSQDPVAPRLAADQGELTRLENTGSGISQIGNRFGRTALRGLNIAGSLVGAVSPIAHNIMQNIPGTNEHHTGLITRQQGRIGEDLGEQKEAAGTAGTQATTGKTIADTGAVPGEIAERAATTAHTQQETSDLQNPKPKDPTNAFELWARQNPDAKASDWLQLEQQSKPNEKPDNLDQQYAEAVAKGDHVTAARILKVQHDIAQAKQAPERPQRQLGVIDGKVVELKPGMDVPQGTESLSGDLAKSKPNAEELKRSEMAENVGENLDKLQDIVTRRPDLFGPLAGRMTQTRMWAGTNDADIAALQTIKDQLGMAQQSAHSMRNAQHVEAAANSILNSFHNEPKAIASSIQTARDSLKTFTRDVQQGNPAVRKEPAGGQGGGGAEPVYATNKTTKERVMSTDGGKTWQPAK